MVLVDPPISYSNYPGYISLVQFHRLRVHPIIHNSQDHDHLAIACGLPNYELMKLL